PYLTMGAAVNDQLVIAEGIPASVPPILAAMRVIGGQPAEGNPAKPPADGKPAAEPGALAKAMIAKIEAAPGGDKALYGAGDINAFQ
ncbi:hypothetical protein ABTL33_19300, partial [Acinetobacter baumannii]